MLVGGDYKNCTIKLFQYIQFTTRKLTIWLENEIIRITISMATILYSSKIKHMHALPKDTTLKQRCPNVERGFFPENMHQTWIEPAQYASSIEKRHALINPLSPHDALKHHFTPLKTDQIFRTT